MTFIKFCRRIFNIIFKCKKICYYENESRRGNVMEKFFKKKEKKGIFDAKEFACYIKAQYFDYTKGTKEITPIKMQKALYFCFAYWAGFVNKGRIDNQLPTVENNLLFDDRFEAWAYGPVVPAVYFNEKDAMLFRTKEMEQEAVQKVEVILDSNSFLKETIDSLLHDLFEISDFKLVSLSHMDKSWQNHFDSYASKHNEEIPHEDIINEYTTKKFD